MANRTILSVAISCILWGSISSSAFADLVVDTTTATDVEVVANTTATDTATTTEPTDTVVQPTPTADQPPATQPATTQQPPPPPVQPTDTTEQPKPTTGTTEQPKPATGTTEQPKPATGITEQPKPATGTTEQPKPTTGTTEQPKPTTDTTEQPKPTTGTTEQPKPTTGTTEQPKPTTGTTEQPKPTTGTTEQPKPTTGTTEQPKPTTDTTEQPKPTTDTTEQPKPTTDTTEQPKPTTDTTEQPKPTTDTTEQPKPTTDTTEQPKPTTDTTEQPKPTTDTTEQPKPTTDTTEQPKPTTGTTEQPKPTTGTTEQPKPTTGTTEQPKPNKPHLADYGVDDADVPKLDADKVHNLPAQAFGAFDKHNIKQVSSDAMTQVTSEQVGQLSTEAVDGLKSEQVNKMPAQAMTGLTAKQLGSLPPVVLQKLPAEHFKNIDTKELQSVDSKDLGKILVNLDATQITPQDVKDSLPEGWEIDDKGRITVPAGTLLTLPTKTVASSDSTVKVEVATEVPDLNKTFSLGGQTTDGSGTVLDGLNNCLKKSGYPNFTMKQQDSGTLKVEGTGDAQGTELTFVAESDTMKQVATDVPTGLSQDETGHFVLTTDDKQQVTVIPTAKDTQQVAESLGAAGTLKIDKHGVAMLEMRKDEKSSKQVRSVVFDPMVTQASDGKTAGIYTEGTTGEIVYADGTAQKIMPTVPLPDKFIEKAQVIPGVEAIQLNADGTFAVKYKGIMLTLRPTQFDAQTTPVAEGQTVDPSIAVQSDGTVKYTTQDGAGTDQLDVTLAITE